MGAKEYSVCSSVELKRLLFRLFFSGAENVAAHAVFHGAKEIAVQVVFSWMAVYVFRLAED